MPKKIPPKPVALSVRDAASFLGVSRSRIYELISAGGLVAYKDGARTLISTASCEEWLERLKPFPTSLPPTGPLLAPRDHKLARRRADPETAPLLPAEQQRLAVELATEPEPPPIAPRQFDEPLAAAPLDQQLDLAAVYAERVKLIRGSYPADSEEPGLRATEHAINVYRQNNSNCDFESAKIAVLAAIGGRGGA